MSAKLAEKMAEVADLHAQLGEAYTELSALFDAASAKSGKSGDDAPAGKVSGRGKSSKVASKDDDDDDDDLPKAKAAAGKGKAGKGKAKKEVTEEEVRKMAMKVVKKHGKEKVEEILGGKLADVDEDDYADKLAELEEALAEEAEEDV